jgi:hypothetical protein
MGYWVDDLQAHQGRLKIGDIVCVLTRADSDGKIVARVTRTYHPTIRRHRPRGKRTTGQYFHFAFYGVVCRSDAAGLRFFVRQILDPDAPDPNDENR